MFESEMGWRDKVKGIKNFSLYILDGYQKGYVDYHIDGDENVVSQRMMPCVCGERLRYVGLLHEANNNYEAFEVCDKCDIGKLF